MEEIKYIILRRIFFWLFFFSFIILTPIILFYSLGYRFDFGLKKFQKTGVISIVTSPKDVVVSLDGRKKADSTPCVFRELLPKKYNLVLEKEGFYPYKIPVEVKSFLVSDINVTLIPKMKNIEKLKLNLNVSKFFFTEHLFNKRLIVFSGDGIYSFGEDFEDVQKIAVLNLDESVINTISGVRIGRNKLVFWNQSRIWMVKMAKSQDPTVVPSNIVYSAQEMIKDVFFALKDKYLIVHDGMKVIALDVYNPEVFFPIIELKTVVSCVFYDTGSETLYIRDKAGDMFSLFRVNLKELTNDKDAF